MVFSEIRIYIIFQSVEDITASGIIKFLLKELVKKGS
jgi:hypothetical protein